MIDPLWLMLIGMVVVLGGILVLRLHAFLALILGAIIVASLTATPALRQFALDKEMTPHENRDSHRYGFDHRQVPAGKRCGRTDYPHGPEVVR
ncbi:MAG: hypothetical protein ACYTAO_17025 [Planctomycetota bacterium]